MRCNFCGIEKPTSEFSRIRGRKCTSCFRSYQHQWYLRHKAEASAASKSYYRKHKAKLSMQHKEWTRRKLTSDPTYFLKYYRQWRERNPDKVKAASRKYWERHKELCNRRSKEYAAKNRLKKRAHYAIGDAVRYRKIIRPSTCSKCGRKAMIHGHHPDYSKKRQVQWLCPKCHCTIHAKALL